LASSAAKRGVLVVDLDADDAALLVRGDADVRRQQLAQRLVRLDVVVLLELEPLRQVALHAVALQERDVELVRRLGRQAAAQTAERAQRAQRRQGRRRPARLLRIGREQRRPGSVDGRQQQRHDQGHERRGQSDDRDEQLALAEPREQVGEADRRAFVGVVAVGRLYRRQRRRGVGAEHREPISS
jgi:hypothetical protein